ncbi:hypothetical protein B0H16DRAFT_1531346 [Mycena metata]|uniref:Uncharacterized protein n=1 Tax=Mycena metata TaxID=1033252 RepID=A0AAD7NG70_9AGAR|nr:hypothetical protein B0H16DRAFT_1531346 [Mycena metata]
MPLPPYSPSAPSPGYSTAPGLGEHILQHTPLAGRHSRPTETSTFIRNEQSMTVVLNVQKENRPSFGREAALTGTLLLKSPETVTALTLKFEGVLESLSPSHGYSSIRMVDQVFSLYVRKTAGPQAHCPAAVPFSCRFPRSFKNNDVHHPIPPSCDIKLPGGAFITCTYSLTFTVLRKVASFFAKEGSLSLELEFRPRTRPSRPRIPNPSLFSTIKTCPEEWLQLPVALTPAPDSRAPDIHCDLFVPSVGVFGVSEVVPFHLQLSGSIRSLRNLLANLGPRSPSPIIRVYLLRQIAVETQGQSPTRINTVLAEGALRPLPPAVFGLHASMHTSRSEDALNWEGEIQLPDIATPTFDVGTLRVMYLIAVELSPPQTSSIKRAHYGYPIKLTTDTWISSAEQGD